MLIPTQVVLCHLCTLCVVGLTLPPMTLWSILSSALGFASPASPLTISFPLLCTISDLSTHPVPSQHTLLTFRHLHPIIRSFHPDLSSQLFIPFHYSYSFIGHPSCYGHQGIPSTSTLPLTASQHLAATLRLQALRSPNTYRMHSRLMRDAGEPHQ